MLARSCFGWCSPLLFLFRKPLVRKAGALIKGVYKDLEIRAIGAMKQAGTCMAREATAK